MLVALLYGARLITVSIYCSIKKDGFHFFFATRVILLKLSFLTIELALLISLTPIHGFAVSLVI